MKAPLVSVFVDGLRPDWVAKMPFVRSLAPAGELGTEFGYSIACHATMYTGKSIQEHGMWFVWQRDTATSQFGSHLSKVPRIADNIGTRLLLRKLLLSRLGAEEVPRGYFGVPRLVGVPVHHWPGLWVSEPRFWDEDSYTSAPTIFEMVRRRGLTHRIIGLHRGGGHLAAVQRPIENPSESTAWYYLFIGEVDHAAHTTGGVGPHFDDVLRSVDEAIRARCEDVGKLHGDFALALFSDHGHQAATAPVDIYRRIRPSLMREVPHVIDTNFARFWPTTDTQRRQVESALALAMPEGWVLSEADMRHWECWFPDGRYGEVIFYLDAPAVFTRTAWGFSRSQRSVHGYIPTNPNMAGTFLTTVDDARVASLRDIFDFHQRYLQF